MTQVSTLQQQLLDAEAVVNELRKKLDEERKGQRVQALAAARELIKMHNLTASDLGFSGKGAAKRPMGDKRTVVAAKYQDPQSEKTWTGRGKSPAWLSAQLAAGHSKEEFLIQREKPSQLEPSNTV